MIVSLDKLYNMSVRLARNKIHSYPVLLVCANTKTRNFVSLHTQVPFGGCKVCFAMPTGYLLEASLEK